MSQVANDYWNVSMRIEEEFWNFFNLFVSFSVFLIEIQPMQLRNTNIIDTSESNYSGVPLHLIASALASTEMDAI